MSMSDKKMSGKQKIEGGFDLNKFVSAAETTENIAPQAQELASQPVSEPKLTKPLSEKKRPAKSITAPQKQRKENLSVRLQIRITPAEFAKIEKQAGMIPHSAFLRKFLQDKGLL